jgi:hypothetical protein
MAGGACALVVAGVAAGMSAAVSAQASTAQGPAMSAAAGTPSAAATALPDGDRLERRRDLLCARVPNAVDRTQQRITRLAGDASVRGSLAWVSARVDEAEAAGRDELATTLRNRLAFRRELAEFLPQRLELLEQARSTICAREGTRGAAAGS